MAKHRQYGRKPHPFALAKKRFSRHRSQAKFRNIDFDFSFEEWYEWWLNHGVDKNVEVKWQGDKRLCMCRYGDKGGYEPSNVYCGTHAENASEAHLGRRKKSYRYGEKLFNIDEIQIFLDDINCGLNKKYFLCHRYNQRIRELAERFSKRFDLTYATHRPKKREWYEGKDACYYTMGEAAKSYGISTDIYFRKKRKNLPGYQTHLIGNRRKYILQRIPHPDAVQILNSVGFEIDK